MRNFIVILSFIFTNISFSQQAVKMYKKGIDKIVHYLSEQNLKHRYYLQYEYPQEDKSTDLYVVVPNCDLDLSTFKQSNETYQKLIISENAKKYFVKNNFLIVCYTEKI